MQCEFTKPDGTRCRAMALRDAKHCLCHDEQSRGIWKDAIKKGGLQKKKPTVLAEVPVMNELKDIMPFINQCIKELRSGDLPPRTANAIGYLINIGMEALKLNNIERKLKEWEHVIQSRNKNI